MFLWVHLFEPHAPYGDGRRSAARWRRATTTRSPRPTVRSGRLLDGLGASRDQTLVVVAADHGEAFGEHGEIGHSVFVYDTTLRVPLVMAGPGLAPRLVEDDVALVDVAPTVATLLGAGPFAADGADLSGPLGGAAWPARELYAESFAPLLDFGWSPLRALRGGGLKVIAAPRPELFDVAADAGESANLAGADRAGTASWLARVDQISPPSLETPAAADPEAARRLQALGYTAGATAAARSLADPKDRRSGGGATRPGDVRRGDRSDARGDAQADPRRRSRQPAGRTCAWASSWPSRIAAPPRNRSSRRRSPPECRPPTRTSDSPGVSSGGAGRLTPRGSSPRPTPWSRTTPSWWPTAASCCRTAVVRRRRCRC